METTSDSDSMSDSHEYIYTPSSSPSHSSTDSIDWNDLTDVIQPIPAYMAAVLAEMRRRYTRSNIRFCGDAAFLRWSMDGNEMQTCFNAPDELDAPEHQFHVGRHWMSYEDSGSLISDDSPAWHLFLEVGVVKAGIEASGMLIQVQIKSFPAEPFWANQFDHHHLVASMADWTAFKHNVLDGAMAQLLQHIEDDVAGGFSEDSTEAYVSDDDVMSDAGEM